MEKPAKKNNNYSYIQPQCLEYMLSEILSAMGISSVQAASIVKYVITCELFGVYTHGLSVFPAHLKKLEYKSYNLSPEFETQKSITYAILNADNAIGFYSATYAMELAINEAQEKGIYTVFARNANTYGAAFYYPFLAASKGLIGITCSNTPAAMNVMGGNSKLLGTNPFSCAVPSKSMVPFIFDMSTSIVAKSKFTVAKNNGEQIPEGWALDEQGVPTTSPEEAIKGSVLPVGGYKGYGLSLCIDLLAGLLSGSGYLNKVGKFYSESKSGMNVGQLFVVINPIAIYGGDFYKDFEEYIELIRNSDSKPNDSITIPGDRKNSVYENNIKNGILVTDEMKMFINDKLKYYNIKLKI